MCAESDVIFTQTPGASTVLEKEWLKPSGVTIIASGSDQPTKQEIPNDVLKASKYIADLVKQTSKVGELRGAIQAGEMTEADVYAELGEVVSGTKEGTRRKRNYCRGSYRNGSSRCSYWTGSVGQTQCSLAPSLSLRTAKIGRAYRLFANE